MKRFLIFLVIGTFCLLTLIPARTLHATNILYEAINLSDTTPGEDLWQYNYTVSDYIFDMDYGFTIFFDYLLYSNLEDPPPAVNADWDPIVWQPDPALPDDGIYDALALMDNASLTDSFSVSFVWLWSDTPGAQDFGIYDDNWTIIESGQTAPVPEPATILLVIFGLFGLAWIKKIF